MNRILLLLVIFLLSDYLPAVAQHNVNYNDVAVVINLNSDSSQIIADYFIAKRKIPAVNVIRVNVTTDEEVNDSTFKDYARQIKEYLNAHDLQDTINYIVTTKGCPLKVARTNVDCNASAESELMLMTVSYEDYYMGDCTSFNDIATDNFLTNPYYNATDSFFKQGFQIYLVTRLDAYSVQEVLNLIDNSGPNVFVDRDSALFVLDQSPNWSGNPLNSAMGTAATILTNRGWNVLLNTDSIYVTDQKNVLGYVSWGSNDGFSQHYTTNAIPHNTWVKGSIAETHVSTSGRSLQPNTTYGQSLIADWIKEGVSGIKGYVYEPFTVAIAISSILFDRYTDLKTDGSPKYNLAQSYFSASRMIGWMDVVIGDPKTSITTNLGLSNRIVEPSTVSFRLFPNPAMDKLYVVSPDARIRDLIIYDLNGQRLIEAQQSGIGSINIGHLPKGMYIAEVNSAGKSEKMRWVKL
ncbi:MAG: TIGR03790 family protein [Bacteroidetes bacterium]|nr:TIGR03790 family protein [Bacteroidota bacterium]